MKVLSPILEDLVLKMKNKKLAYILLPIVVIVWGLVIYRMFFEGRTKPENLTQFIRPIVKESVEEKSETYKLIANYRDPFLSNVVVSEVIAQENKQEEQSGSNTNLRRRRTSVSRIRWPEVKYGGFIEGNGEKQTILLKIKNRDFLAQKGDTIEQIFIKEFYGDSLVVVYSNEEKTLKK